MLPEPRRRGGVGLPDPNANKKAVGVAPTA